MARKLSQKQPVTGNGVKVQILLSVVCRFCIAIMLRLLNKHTRLVSSVAEHRLCNPVTSVRFGYEAFLRGGPVPDRSHKPVHAGSTPASAIIMKERTKNDASIMSRAASTHKT